MSEYNKVVAENKDEIKAIIEKEKQLKMEIAITRVEDADTQHEVHKLEEVNKKLIETITKEFQKNENLQVESNNLRDIIKIVSDRIAERRQENRINKQACNQRIEELNDNILELQADLREINQTATDTKVIVNERTNQLNSCLIEASDIICDLNRKIRLSNLKEKGRVYKTRHINNNFANAVKQKRLKMYSDGQINADSRRLSQIH